MKTPLAPRNAVLPIPHNPPWTRGVLEVATPESETLSLLPVEQVQYLVKKKHIYIPKNGRINFTCINACNIDYITESINEAIIFTKDSEKESSESR